MTALLAEELGDEEFGQYAMDHRYDPDDPRLNIDPTGTKAARGDGDDGMHINNLFDQGSAVPDEATGLATGTRINKDPFYDFTVNGLSIVDGIGGAAGAEIAKRRSPKLDDAERWIIENDPNDPRYKPKEDVKIGARA